GDDAAVTGEAVSDGAPSETRVGAQCVTPEEAVATLRHWQVTHAAAIEIYAAEALEYAELEALLGGGTLEELEQQVERRERQGALPFEAETLPEASEELDLDREIARLEAAAHLADREATVAETSARERAKGLPSVAEAEEELAQAQAELQRVARLERTLGLTLDFLRKAEERVHRDLAPVLAAGV